ncbi:MAG: hypothetical protein F6K61_01970 [Sphaerospermopsis sp. SIO1G1]|nr:hypothetical protein [Sphaerospermopsis sp. SIO1G1]
MMVNNWASSKILQDLSNEDLSLRLKRSVGKQSQDFCDYVAIARNDAVNGQKTLNMYSPKTHSYCREFSTAKPLPNT